MTHTIKHAKKAHRKARKEGSTLSLKAYVRAHLLDFLAPQGKLAQILRVSA